MLSAQLGAVSSTCRLQHAVQWLPAVPRPRSARSRPQAGAQPASPLAIDYGTVHVGISWRDGERNVPVCVSIHKHSS